MAGEVEIEPIDPGTVVVEVLQRHADTCAIGGGVGQQDDVLWPHETEAAEAVAERFGVAHGAGERLVGVPIDAYYDRSSARLGIRSYRRTGPP